MRIREMPITKRLWSLAPLVLVLACGRQLPGDDDEQSDDSATPDLPTEDPWNCGELGLKCVGPLGIGECVQGECQATLGGECWVAASVGTCEQYCGMLGRTCAELACDGATAYGWQGEPEMASVLCLDADHATAVPLELGCDEPLEGTATVLMCCCDP